MKKPVGISAQQSVAVAQAAIARAEQSVRGIRGAVTPEFRERLVALQAAVARLAQLTGP